MKDYIAPICFHIRISVKTLVHFFYKPAQGGAFIVWFIESPWNSYQTDSCSFLSKPLIKFYSALSWAAFTLSFDFCAAISGFLSKAIFCNMELKEKLLGSDPERRMSMEMHVPSTIHGWLSARCLKQCTIGWSVFTTSHKFQFSWHLGLRPHLRPSKLADGRDLERVVSHISLVWGCKRFVPITWFCLDSYRVLSEFC